MLRIASRLVVITCEWKADQTRLDETPRITTPDKWMKFEEIFISSFAPGTRRALHESYFQISTPKLCPVDNRSNLSECVLIPVTPAFNICRVFSE